MKKIYKYVLNDATNNIATYEGMKILYVDNQREHITIWAEVNPLARECMIRLHVVGTGQHSPPNSSYVGSALMADGDFVFHIYSEGRIDT